MKNIVSFQDIEKALSYISATCDRDTWARIAMAIKSELGDSGFDLFDSWSRGGDGYNKQDCKDTWKSVKAGGGISIGTLFHLAKESGWKPGHSEPPSPEQVKQHKAQQEQKAAQADRTKAKQEAGWKKAKSKALSLWESASTVTSHPYLARKNINSEGLRVSGELLLVPIVDPANGEIWNLQSIYPKPTNIRGSNEPRDKDYIPGGKKSGLCHVIKANSESTVIYLAEGLATGKSINEVSNSTVYVSFDSGNLKHISQTVRKLYPDKKIVIVADNDAHLRENDGVKKARAAAKLIEGLVFVPHFPKEAITKLSENERLTDFNDLCQIIGKDEAKRQLLSVTTNTLPSGFYLNQKGLFYSDPYNSGHSVRVCSKLEIKAITRSDKDKEWGALLSWTDPGGNSHSWSVSLSLLESEGAEWRKTLADGGLIIGCESKARTLLAQYIKRTVEESLVGYARCVTKTGWYKDSYVLPEQVLGSTQNDEEIVLQSLNSDIPGYGLKGDLEGWKTSIGKMCIDNSLLVLAISAAFSPVLQDLIGAESGGFHFYASSSVGKSTTAYIAGSVWGGHDRMRRWRATDNGLEGTAELHNDSLLILDEIKELDAKIAGQVVYMICNRQGKARAGRGGEYKAPANWRVGLISTGEISVIEHIKSSGQTAFAGHEVRIIDLPAEIEGGHGIFENLHGLESGFVMSDYFKQVTQENYGHPSREFIKHVVDDKESVSRLCKELREEFVTNLVPNNADGQVKRVADRFAVTAVAGELATRWGITGWEPGEAIKAAGKSLKTWISLRGGTGKKEVIQIVRKVKNFLQENSDSRFEDLDTKSTTGFHIVKKAGYKGGNKEQPDNYLFYIFPEVFETEVLQGFDNRYALRVLKDEGFLYTNEQNRSKVKMATALDDGSRPRMYAVKASILEYEQ